MSATVVYIEDHPATREMASKILEVLGYTAITFHHAGLALEYLRKNGADIVLTDLHMPEVDGYKFVSAIRSQPELTKIPIIAISADTTRENLKRCHELGFDAFYGKPIMRKDLQEIFTKYLPA